MVKNPPKNILKVVQKKRWLEWKVLCNKWEKAMKKNTRGMKQNKKGPPPCLYFHEEGHDVQTQKYMAQGAKILEVMKETKLKLWIALVLKFIM